MFILHMVFIPFSLLMIVVLLFKGLEVIDKMIEPKFEIVTKRQVAITLAGDDVDRLDEVLKAVQSADMKDRRLYNFAKTLSKKIDEQKIMIGRLDAEDHQTAIKELLSQYEEKQIVDLTDVVPTDDDGS